MIAQTMYIEINYDTMVVLLSINILILSFFIVLFSYLYYVRLQQEVTKRLDRQMQMKELQNEEKAEQPEAVAK